MQWNAERGGWERTEAEKRRALQEGWNQCTKCGGVFWFPRESETCNRCTPSTRFEQWLRELKQET